MFGVNYLDNEFTNYRTAGEINQAMGRVYGYMGLATLVSMVVSLFVGTNPELVKFFFTGIMHWVVIFAPLVAVFGIGLYLTLNRSSSDSWNTMNAVKNFIHVLPMDRNSKDMIKPFLEKDQTALSVDKIHASSRTHKRSVSETKKKYIASQQNWKCKQCNEQLTAWFEVDHVKRLDQGGTNDVQNLVALCRNCHGEKTSMENI